MRFLFDESTGSVKTDWSDNNYVFLGNTKCRLLAVYIIIDFSLSMFMGRDSGKFRMQRRKGSGTLT